MKTNEPPRITPSLMLKETFHSFEINDEFTAFLLAEIATISKIKLSSEEMIAMATKFIQGKKKMGLIESVPRTKWTVSINGKVVKRQVYRKVGELSSYKTKVQDPIPDEYFDFVDLWNEQGVGSSFTADEFHELLNVEGIPVTYNGQCGKFLWLIADRGLCDCIKATNQRDNLYTRIDSIPDYLLDDNGTKFMKIRTGPYKSVLKLLGL